VIISSPAGSGKTEKLARRYISLLKSGTPIERILSITFTERAAAEMKERILSILKREDPETHAVIKDKSPLMRISTIHSFCLSVLKRFSIELGLDPSLDIAEPQATSQMWSDSMYEALMAERDEHGMFFDSMQARGLKSWGPVKRFMEAMHAMAPQPEILLRSGGEALERLEGPALEMLSLYSEVHARYKRKKTDMHLLDFVDLEVLALEALSIGQEAHNILYSFDEHTDHILVDEFQDTSHLQWKIIDKLTEEWRSGLGAKRDSGVKPTLFLVGDEKQSIYLFRGANAGVFRRAEDKLATWMGKEYTHVQVKENYRSLKSITRLVNVLFEEIMSSDPPEDWMTRYSPFESQREGEGASELILFKGAESSKQTRQKEAEILAKRILSLTGDYEVITPEGKRPCMFKDMAILLNKRTHLGVLESELLRAGVPFVILKGIGFYYEPEVATIRELLSFLTDPSDSHCLFCVLRSPLFKMSYAQISLLALKNKPLYEALRESDNTQHQEAATVLESWLALRHSTPVAVLLEHALTSTGGWAGFREPQRHANIKKFLTIIEGMEDEGLWLIEIRERLMRARNSREASKANINAEGMDAVKIMTVHASKGLQFPMVFLPGMDENLAPRSGPMVMHEDDGTISLAFEEDSAKRRKMSEFRYQKNKEAEEQKRLFYVAITRAMDFLCMTGAEPGDKGPKGRLSYLNDAFGIFKDSGHENTGPGVTGGGGVTGLPFTILSELELPTGKPGAASAPQGTKMSSILTNTDPLPYSPHIMRVNVTDDTDLVLKDHGGDWTLTGTVLHKILEEISYGTLELKDITARARRHLKTSPAHGLDTDEIISRIEAGIMNLKTSGLMDEVVLPRGSDAYTKAYTELPFEYLDGHVILSGRIDRVLVRDKEVLVYDYKSFPVGSEEEEALIRQYEGQMRRYAHAAGNLFDREARAFLVLTHEGKLIEIKL